MPGSSIEALEEALARYGKPTISSSNQGSQFTSTAFAAVVHREKNASGRTPDQIHFASRFSQRHD